MGRLPRGWPELPTDRLKNTLLVAGTTGGGLQIRLFVGEKQPTTEHNEHYRTLGVVHRSKGISPFHGFLKPGFRVCSFATGTFATGTFFLYSERLLEI